MKCAICAKHITDARYASHLESKHGMTQAEAEGAAAMEVEPDADPTLESAAAVDATVPLETSDEDGAGAGPSEEDGGDEDTAAREGGPPPLVVPPPQLADAEPADDVVGDEDPEPEPEPEPTGLPEPAPVGPWPVPAGAPPTPAPTIGPATAPRWPRVAASAAVAVALFVGAFFVARAINDDGGNKSTAKHAAAPAVDRRTTTSQLSSTTLPFGALPPPTVPVGPRPGAPSTVPPPVTTPPVAAPSNPAAQMQFSFAGGECGSEAAGTNTGPMSINGTVRNAGAGTYNLQFTVNVLRGDRVIGTGTAAVTALGPGEQRSFVATGTCSEPLGGGNSAQAKIDSITPA